MIEISELKERYKQAQMILIGVGSELSQKKMHADDIIVLKKLATEIEHKNYFVITSNTDCFIEQVGLNPKRVAQPLLIAKEVDETIKDREEKQWELYNKWLSATLNKNLLVIELGEGFQNPGLFRWPFEKITMINQKSYFYRVHENFSQLPEEITERAASVEMYSLDFLKTIMPV